MASIVLRAYAGMAPSANLRAVDPSVASYCANLNLRFTDFRPLPAAENVGAGTNGHTTLYRFQAAGGFITKAGTVNYVRGPIATDTTERTYYTGDGAPKVTDLTSAVRQLGVPKPGSAPTVVVNVTDEYSEADAETAKGTKLSEIISAVWTNCTTTYLGLTDSDLGTTWTAGSEPWVFGFKIAGSMVSGAFVPTNTNHNALLDEANGYHLGTISSVTYGFVDVHLRGATTALGAGLAAALGAVKDPSDLTNTNALLTSAQITSIVSELTDALKPANTERDAAIGRLKLLASEFVSLANTGSAASSANIENTKTFYARTDVNTAITNAIANAAQAISYALNSYNSETGF